MDQELKANIEQAIVKAREKLAAACKLCEEGYYSDAISRAYYAAYYAAEAAMLSLGINVKSHKGMKMMLGKHLILTGKIDPKYGRWFADLCDERENEDYELFAAFSEEDARRAVVQAEEFVAVISKLLLSP